MNNKIDQVPEEFKQLAKDFSENGLHNNFIRQFN